MSSRVTCRMQARPGDSPRDRRLQNADASPRAPIPPADDMPEPITSEVDRMAGFVLTACQRKGGVGRSTLFYNLAGSLSKQGLKVLICDLDPQASISQVCLSPEAVDALPEARTVVAVMG